MMTFTEWYNEDSIDEWDKEFDEINYTLEVDYIEFCNRNKMDIVFDID